MNVDQACKKTWGEANMPTSTTKDFNYGHKVFPYPSYIYWGVSMHKMVLKKKKPRPSNYIA